MQMLACQNLEIKSIVSLNEIYRFSNLDISSTKFICQMVYDEITKYHNNQKNVTISHEICRYLTANQITSTTCAKTIKSRPNKYSDSIEAILLLKEYMQTQT